MPENVKCADCGYLAAYHLKSATAVAATAMLRQKGFLLDSEGPSGPRVFDQYPICFVQQIDFRKEIARPNEAEIHAAIQKTRTCPAFTELQAGLGPKDHLEMKLLAIERERAEMWRQGVEDRIESRHRSNFLLQALIGILTVAGSIIGSLIAVGKIQLW